MYNFVHSYIPLSVHFYFIINTKMVCWETWDGSNL